MAQMKTSSKNVGKLLMMIYRLKSFNGYKYNLSIDTYRGIATLNNFNEDGEQDDYNSGTWKVTNFDIIQLIQDRSVTEINGSLVNLR